MEDNDKSNFEPQALDVEHELPASGSDEAAEPR